MYLKHVQKLVFDVLIKNKNIVKKHSSGTLCVNSMSKVNVKVKYDFQLMKLKEQV